MLIRPGLVSVTFRQLSPAEVVAAATGAGLAAIEWGGDVHVPHGDYAAAARVAELTASAGLEVAAYGSYYRVGHSAGEGLDPAAVVRTAAVLGAPTIRVWAGRLGSAAAGEADRAAVVADARRLAGLAGEDGLTISFEYHRDTLTDTRASAARLLADLPDPVVGTLWQPRPERDRAENLDDLRAVLPRLGNVHVFAWSPPRDTRHPLAAGAADWAAYLAEINQRYRGEHHPASPGAGVATGRDLPGDGAPLAGDGVDLPGDGAALPAGGDAPPGGGNTRPGDGSRLLGRGTALPGGVGEGTGAGEPPAATRPGEAGRPGASRRYALLEFVVDDDPARLASDAATLHRLLAR